MSLPIPIIDFNLYARSPKDRQVLVHGIDDALRTFGFFYIKNHGIDQAKIETYFTMSKRLFSLPEHTRQAFARTRQSDGQGYLGIGQEQVRGQKCIKESFGFSDPVDEAIGSWPDEELLPGFRGFAADFNQACTGLVNELIQCLSMALGLSQDDSLNQYHTSSKHVSSLIHYPAVPSQSIHVRTPAHSDFGILTLLFQDHIGGLEIADMSSTSETASAAVEKSARFMHIDPQPGTVIVNVGYLLMRWTNGRWKNTVHRVVEPPFLLTVDKEKQETKHPTGPMAPDRYSIAFFSFPDAETIVQPLTVCCSEQEPKKWGPIHAGKYLQKKRAALYSDT
ncbi:MAG: hypothetical protein Q9160_007174 [Pyrenula sp. 1 TL-2023]